MAMAEAKGDHEEEESSSSSPSWCSSFSSSSSHSFPLHGDMLEVTLSYVPLVHLLPACHVSKSWSQAVSSSLHNLNPIKPWLLVHTQATRSPYSLLTRAYDPRSRVWMDLQRASSNHTSTTLRSSNLLFNLSPTKFSFSFDALNLTWHHVDPPFIWRADPIVALVGHYIVVAGGACDFDDDPFAVEIYDLKTGAWSSCDSMPALIKDCSASITLSVAVGNGVMHVAERASGVIYTFDPKTKAWKGPCNLRPVQGVYDSIIGIVDDRLVMLGVMGDKPDVKRVKLWKGEGGDSCLPRFKEIGEMPEEFTKKLTGDKGSSSSMLNMCWEGRMLYIYNAIKTKTVVSCEVDDERCAWGSVENVAGVDEESRARVVFSCGKVSLEELRSAALAPEECRFLVRERENRIEAESKMN